MHGLAVRSPCIRSARLRARDMVRTRGSRDESGRFGIVRRQRTHRADDAAERRDENRESCGNTGVFDHTVIVRQASRTVKNFRALITRPSPRYPRQAFGVRLANGLSQPGSTVLPDREALVRVVRTCGEGIVKAGGLHDSFPARSAPSGWGRSAGKKRVPSGRERPRGPSVRRCNAHAQR